MADIAGGNKITKRKIILLPQVIEKSCLLKIDSTKTSKMLILPFYLCALFVNHSQIWQQTRDK